MTWPPVDLGTWVQALQEPDLTGVATVVLVAATGLLVIATGRLAKITKEDGKLRRIEATRAAWLMVRAYVDLPDLSNEPADESIVEKVNDDLRATLRQIEAYAVCINARVFDIEIFDRMSGGWYLQNYARIRPYIEYRHLTMSHHPYGEMIVLNLALIKLRKGRKPRLYLTVGVEKPGRLRSFIERLRRRGRQ